METILTANAASAAPSPLAEFAMLFRKNLRDNRKSLLLGLVTAWGLCILYGSILGFVGRGGGFMEVTFFFILIQFLGNVFGSMAFSEMKTKEGRIASIMLPASTFNKFAVKWTLVVPVLAAVLLAGFYLGDIARILMDMLVNDGRSAGCNYYKIVNPFTVLYSAGIYESGLRTNFILSYFFGQAVFVFGAILWPKLSFIKTFAAIYAIQMLLGLLILGIDKLFDFSLTPDNLKTLGYCFIVGQAVLTILLYWLTYRRLRTSEVVYKLF